MMDPQTVVVDAATAVSDRVKRSVDALQRLYTIVIGLALTEGARRVVDPNLSTETGRLSQDLPQSVPWMLFLALVITIVPFYHGANRHLDDAYVFGVGAEVSRRAVILDFFILFAEGVFFVMMGMSVLSPTAFFQWFWVLLAVDAAWATLSLIFKKPAGPLAKWLFVNLAALILTFTLLYTPLLTDDRRVQMLVIIATARTLLDYALSWSFYMGEEHAPAV